MDFWRHTMVDELWRDALTGGVRVRMSLTVVGTLSPLWIVSWRCRMFPLRLFVSSCRAACVFPWNISFAKDRASSRSLPWGRCWGRRFCIALPSLTSPGMSPSSHSFNRLSKHAMWSFVLEFWCDFWSTRSGSTVAAFRATDSSAEPEAKARNRRASSFANDLPAFPWGILKQFFFQCTASS